MRSTQPLGKLVHTFFTVEIWEPLQISTPLDVMFCRGYDHRLCRGLFLNLIGNRLFNVIDQDDDPLQRRHIDHNQCYCSYQLYDIAFCLSIFASSYTPVIEPTSKPTQLLSTPPPDSSPFTHNRSSDPASEPINLPNTDEPHPSVSNTSLSLSHSAQHTKTLHRSTRTKKKSAWMDDYMWQRGSCYSNDQLHFNFYMVLGLFLMSSKVNVFDDLRVHVIQAYLSVIFYSNKSNQTTV